MMLINCIIAKHSEMANAVQYVLTELFRNVFLKKIMMEITFPINPIPITAVSIIETTNVNDDSDIFSL